MKVGVRFNPATPWDRRLASALSELLEVQEIRSTGERSAAQYIRDIIITRRGCRGANLLLTLYGGSYAAAAMVSGVRPYVVYAVGSDVAGLLGWKRTVASMALQRAALVITNGEWLASQARALAGDTPVVSVPHGIDLRQFRFQAPTATHPAILVTRGFAPVYNQPLIAKAMAAVRSPRVTITFADGTTGWRELAAEVERKAPHWQGRAFFMGGIPHQDMPTLMGKHTHYLSMSSRDGVAASLLESMATGLSPIVSDIPATREWLGDEEGIWIPLDAQAVPTLARVLENPPRIPGTALRANRKRVESRADINQAARTLAKLLLNVAP